MNGGAEPLLHVALLHPEIGPNAGNAGRLCLGLGARLHLVHPLGFQTDDKAVRRAGLDYWKHVDVVEHEDAHAFFQWVGTRPLHLFSARGGEHYLSAHYQRGDVLLFGRESRGLPQEVKAAHPDRLRRIPVGGPVRSLNLSNAVAVAAYGAMARIAPAQFGELP
jgi:tRNA (cytidine/uridine-2'-O-)-methyltransferase